MLVNPSCSARRAASLSISAEMSVARIVPVDPTFRAANRLWSPVPAAISRTWSPGPSSAASSMSRVASPKRFSRHLDRCAPCAAASSDCHENCCCPRSISSGARSLSRGFSPLLVRPSHSHDGPGIALVMPGPTIYREVGPIDHLTVQSLRQEVEMDVPASKIFAQASVGSGKRAAEGQNAAVGHFLQFPTEYPVNIARVLQQSRWIELRNGRVHDGGVPVLIGVEPA